MLPTCFFKDFILVVGWFITCFIISFVIFIYYSNLKSMIIFIYGEIINVVAGNAYAYK